jgi:hypothetical protein
MLLSGRHHAQPNEGLIGAHTERRLPRSTRAEDQLPEVEGDEPIGAGADVLPGSPRDRTLMRARKWRESDAAKKDAAFEHGRDVAMEFQPESGQPGEREPRDAEPPSTSEEL